MLVGRLLSFWDGLFSGAMLNFEGVQLHSKSLYEIQHLFVLSTGNRCANKRKHKQNRYTFFEHKSFDSQINKTDLNINIISITSPLMQLWTFSCSPSKYSKNSRVHHKHQPLHDKINPKDCQVASPLVIAGFSNFLGLFQGIMANPESSKKIIQTSQTAGDLSAWGWCIAQVVLDEQVWVNDVLTLTTC